MALCVSCRSRRGVQLEARQNVKEVKINELLGELVEKREKLAFLQLPSSWIGNEEEPTKEKTWKGDIAIIVRSNTEDILHAHKFVLSCRSPVFRKMFEIEMLEKEARVVRIDDATHPVVVAMINFCYTTKIKFNDEEVTPEDVLEIAHKYSIDLLQKLCVNEMQKTISEGNLPKRLKLASKFEVKSLEKATVEYFKDNFDSVISTTVNHIVIPPSMLS